MKDRVSKIEDERALERVRDGMRVFDSRGREVGRVDRVFMGAVSERADARGQGAATAPADTSYAVGGVLDRVPDVLRERLLRLGFARIDAAGLFAGHRFFLPDQIAAVSQDRVDLKVAEDELIRPTEI